MGFGNVKPRLKENTTKYSDANYLLNKSGLNSISKFGNLMSLIKANPKRITKPSDIILLIDEDFKFNKDEENKFKMDYATFIKKVTEFCMSNPTYAPYTDETVEYAKDLVTTKTFIGHKSEMDLVTMLRKVYPNLLISITKAQKDADYAVDVVVRNRELTKLIGIQLKPMSWVVDFTNMEKNAAFVNDMRADFKDVSTEIIRYTYDKTKDEQYNFNFTWSNLKHKIKEVFDV